MKTYVATRNQYGVTAVKVHGDPSLKRSWYLRPRLDLLHYCPDPFEWGYTGPAAAQLSLALLADHFGHYDDTKAKELHQTFLREFVVHLPRDGWTISGDDISRALNEQAARTQPA
jgi:hypothetical protein